MKSLCSGVVRELSPARNTELTQHECRPGRRADRRGPVWWGHARHADEEPLRGTAARAPGARRGAPPPPVCRDGSSPRTAGCRTRGGTAAAHAHPRRPAAASPAGAVVRVTGPGSPSSHATRRLEQQSFGLSEPRSPRPEARGRPLRPALRAGSSPRPHGGPPSGCVLRPCLLFFLEGHSRVGLGPPPPSDLRLP